MNLCREAKYLIRIYQWKNCAWAKLQCILAATEMGAAVLSINLAAPPCSQVFLDNTGDVALALRKSFLYLITLQDSTSIFFLCGLYPGVDLLWLFWDPALPLL